MFINTIYRDFIAMLSFKLLIYYQMELNLFIYFFKLKITYILNHYL